MTLKEYLVAFMGLSLSVSGVSAGNAWFEPSNRFSSSHAFRQPFQTVAANATIRDPFSRGVEGAPGKRWVTVDPSEDSNIILWPDKTIKYCFEDTESRGRFYDLIIKGMDLWYQAGLDSSFKMTEVSDNDCRNKPSEVMLVSVGKALSTTTALPVSERPTMMLTDSDEMGMLNVLSNVAHEIGHAWGLYHEHQNAKFWDAPYIPGRSGKLFGASNFHCENLKDYEVVMERIQKLIDKQDNEDNVYSLERQRKEVCTQRSTAKVYGFSASEYLPLMANDYPRVETDDISKIDWESIMLYPSGAGGKNLGNGERLPILTHPNGDEIGLNLVPSPRDVAGLTALYGLNEKHDEVLHSETQSSKYKIFNKIRNKDTGSCD